MSLASARNLHRIPLIGGCDSDTFLMPQEAAPVDENGC